MSIPAVLRDGFMVVVYVMEVLGLGLLIAFWASHYAEFGFGNFLLGEAIALTVFAYEIVFGHGRGLYHTLPLIFRPKRTRTTRIDGVAA